MNFLHRPCLVLGKVILEVSQHNKRRVQSNELSIELLANKSLRINIFGRVFNIYSEILQRFHLKKKKKKKNRTDEDFANFLARGSAYQTISSFSIIQKRNNIISFIRNSQTHAKKQVMVYAMPPQQSWQLQHVTQGARNTCSWCLPSDHSVGRTWNPPAVSGGALSASAWARIDIGPQNTTLPPQPPAIRENTNTLFATQAKQSYKTQYGIRYTGQAKLYKPSTVFATQAKQSYTNPAFATQTKQS